MKTIKKMILMILVTAVIPASMQAWSFSDMFASCKASVSRNAGLIVAAVVGVCAVVTSAVVWKKFADRKALVARRAAEAESFAQLQRDDNRVDAAQVELIVPENNRSNDDVRMAQQQEVLALLRQTHRVPINLNYCIDSLIETSQSIQEKINKLVDYTHVRASVYHSQLDDITAIILRYKDKLKKSMNCLSHIMLREGLTFNVMEKQYQDNFKKIENADVSKAYEYLGLDPHKAYQYSSDDITERMRELDSFMKDECNQGSVQFNQIRQSEIILHDDLAREEYDQFLQWIAAGKPDDYQMTLQLPSKDQMQELIDVRAQLNTAWVKLAEFQDVITQAQAKTVQDTEAFKSFNQDFAQKLQEINIFLNKAECSPSSERRDLNKVNEYMELIDILRAKRFEFRSQCYLAKNVCINGNYDIFGIDHAYRRLCDRFDKLDRDLNSLGRPQITAAHSWTNMAIAVGGSLSGSARAVIGSAKRAF